MDKKKVYLLAAVTLAVTFVVDFLFSHPHHHNWWNEMPGFDILFGFPGCAVLIFVAKKIVAPILQRKEDYYEGGEDDE